MEEVVRKIEIVEKVNYRALTHCINNKELSDGDILHLNAEDYNNFVNSNLFSYTSYLKEPFYLDEVLIEPADIRKNRILVIVALNPPQPVSKDIHPRFSAIYRCGWCGNVVAEDGGLLTIKTRNQMIKTIEKFKNIKMIAVDGACCPNKSNEQTDLEKDTEEFERIVYKIFTQNKITPISNVREDVYKITIQRFKDIQKKQLSEVDDDDLTFLGFVKVEHKDFANLYHYKDFDLIKKYFIKEGDEFEMRGFRLDKEKNINSVQELIDNYLIYWRLKINI